MLISMKYRIQITFFISLIGLSGITGANSQQIQPGQIPQGISGSDWQSIQQQMTSHAYEPQQLINGSYTALNKVNGWKIDYLPTGETILRPLAAAKTYQIGIKISSLNNTPYNHAIQQTTQGNTLTTKWDNSLTEWWVNSETGIEQWFEIAHPLNSSGWTGSPLTLTLQLNTDLDISQQANQLNFTTPKGHKITYNKLKAWDATGNTLTSQMVLNGNQLSLLIDDSHATYPITIDPIFSQQAYIKASNTEEDDRFGTAVSLSGDTLAVGAASEDSNATGINGSQDDNSAESSGAVYIFIRSEGSWSQQAYLKASNTGTGDLFGLAVSLSGDSLAVGAIFEASNATGINGNQDDNSAENSGAVYLFTRSGSSWSQQAYLKASNTDEDDQFGYAVSLSGDSLAVGAYKEASNTTGINGNQVDNSATNSGAVYLFTRSGNNWGQQAYIKASNTDARDIFGYTVSLSGDSLAVGAVSEASNATGINSNQADNSADTSGAVYLFTRSGSSWSQQAYIKASNSSTDDHFGQAVSLSGDSLAVGADEEASNATGVNGNQDNDSASRAGAVYLFTRNGSNWSQQAYIKASNTDIDDRFGGAVSLSGDSLAVGAPYEGNNSGSTYLFTRNGTNWSEQASFKASNAGVNNYFGLAVSLSGDNLVVAAPYEGSNATGINGDQDNNSASRAGAVYSFMNLPAAAGDCNESGGEIDIMDVTCTIDKALNLGGGGAEGADCNESGGVINTTDVVCTIGKVLIP